jgi:hypothetical protein
MITLLKICLAGDAVPHICHARVTRRPSDMNYRHVTAIVRQRDTTHR